MKTVLIVEDEVLVGLDLALQLEDEGYRCVGPASDIAAALELVRAEALDFAILDANLDGVSSAPIAEMLTESAVPFIYVTGYDKDHVSQNLPAAEVVSKPLHFPRLLKAIRRHLEAG